MVIKNRERKRIKRTKNIKRIKKKIRKIHIQKVILLKINLNLPKHFVFFLEAFFLSGLCHVWSNTNWKEFL